jgi:hypothetical protein
MRNNVYVNPLFNATFVCVNVSSIPLGGRAILNMVMNLQVP